MTRQKLWGHRQLSSSAAGTGRRGRAFPGRESELAIVAEPRNARPEVVEVVVVLVIVETDLADGIAVVFIHHVAVAVADQLAPIGTLPLVTAGNVELQVEVVGHDLVVEQARLLGFLHSDDDGTAFDSGLETEQAELGERRAVLSRRPLAGLPVVEADCELIVHVVEQRVGQALIVRGDVSVPMGGELIENGLGGGGGGERRVVGEHEFLRAPTWKETPQHAATRKKYSKKKVFLSM